MIPLKFPSLWPCLACLLVLAACAPVPTRVTSGEGEAGQAAREARLRESTTWAFQGRVAIDHDGQAGTARIAWSQRGDDFDITLSAPLTRQSWRLLREGGRARIEGLGSGVREGTDAEALLLDATGWRIPVDALASWVRGMRADPGQAVMDVDPSGRPASLAEGGWQVEYRQWDQRQPPLPTRVFARREGDSVRLAVERWSSP